MMTNRAVSFYTYISFMLSAILLVGTICSGTRAEWMVPLIGLQNINVMVASVLKAKQHIPGKISSRIFTGGSIILFIIGFFVDVLINLLVWVIPFLVTYIFIRIRYAVEDHTEFYCLGGKKRTHPMCLVRKFFRLFYISLPYYSITGLIIDVCIVMFVPAALFGYALWISSDVSLLLKLAIYIVYIGNMYWISYYERNCCGRTIFGLFKN